MHEDVTQYLGLQQPHPANTLEQDVMRLREMIAQADVLFRGIQQAMAVLVATINGKPGPNVQIHPEDVQLGPANGASASAIEYNGDGSVHRITDTIGGDPAVSTLGYDGDGNVSTIVTTYRGRTRTETVAYEGGAVSGITAVEVPA